MKFRKAPIPLVEVDDDSKFSVNPEAREILEGLRVSSASGFRGLCARLSSLRGEKTVARARRRRGKICVVSVAGLYRTGKSSLVNFLLDADSGFTVGPTVRRRGLPRRCVLWRARAERSFF